MGFLNRSLLDALAEWTLVKITTFNSQELANSAWTCAKLTYLNEALLKSIADSCLQEIGNFNPQDFANITWSFSKVIYLNLPVLGAICEMAVHCINEFNCQDLANTAWAIANLLVRNDNLMKSIADHAEGRQDDMGSLSWSFFGAIAAIDKNIYKHLFLVRLHPWNTAYMEWINESVAVYVHCE